MTNALAPIEKARKMLQEATTLQDILQVRNIAQRARDFAKAAGMGREAANAAKRIELDARIRAGEMLAEMKARGELREGRPQKNSNDVLQFSLNEIGISRMESSRYQQEAAVPKEQYELWVQETVDAGKELTSRGLAKLSKRSHRKEWADEQEPIEGICDSLQSLIDDGKRFRCVYADPPWAYNNQETRAATDNHYDTMSVEQICAEPVSQLAADDAHLHLWTTNAFLFDAKRVMEAWGFEYRSCFIWVKPQMGIGNYWRVSHEFMLLGIRGNATNFLANDEPSWLEVDRTKHSQKPYEIRRKVERVSPGPYLEMYGREVVPGWTVYGNQIEKGLF